jgi:hypothetical protein
VSRVKQTQIQLQTVSSNPARSSPAIQWSSLSWSTDVPFVTLFTIVYGYRRFTLCSQEPTSILKKLILSQSRFSRLSTKMHFQVFPENFRKPAASFVMSVRLYVRPRGVTRLPLDGVLWTLYARTALKCGMKIQFSLKLKKNVGRITWRPNNIWYWNCIMTNVLFWHHTQETRTTASEDGLKESPKHVTQK